jgi:hypothetical protein
MYGIHDHPAANHVGHEDPYMVNSVNMGHNQSMYGQQNHSVDNQMVEINLNDDEI